LLRHGSGYQRRLGLEWLLKKLLTKQMPLPQGNPLPNPQPIYYAAANKEGCVWGIAHLP